MPINRAPFNALIDDDGSGTIGTVWNKAAIQGVVLDPIDAYVGGTLIDVPFNPADFTANGGGTFVVSAGNAFQKYAIVAGILYYFGYLRSVTITGAPSNLYIRIPAGKTVLATSLGVGYGATAGSGYEVLASINAIGANVMALYRPGIQIWPASPGNAEIYTTSIIPVG